MSSRDPGLIVLYDIPGNSPGKAWSPNTWKTRYALNYKGLPYRTVWVEYPNIAGLCKSIGASPTSTQPDGAPLYTLPAIFDPSTNTGLAESALIARYLDRTYPDTPTLISPETDAFHAAFQEAFLITIQQRMLPIMLPPTAAQLNPFSEAYFRETRESWFEKRLEEFSPAGLVRERQWKALQDAFSQLSGWMAMDGRDKPFFMGETICHADITIAGWLVWIRIVLGAESAEWAAIKSWDGGRWGKFMAFFETYESVDE